MKGYKVFNPDFTANGGNFQYAENTTFEMDLPIKICSRGFHFCEKASDCFSYYDFDPKNIVCEVESLDKVELHNSDSKVCTNKILIGRKLSWDEVLKVANEGINNTGHSNSSNRNSGYRNSGNWNSGNSNSGNWNSGDSNSGDRNSGYRNSGYRNSGDSNSGDSNSGNWNSGNRNSGDSNSGDSNSGDSNSGDSNSGNWNSGYRNSGDSNSGYRNSGAFCTDVDPILYLFNKPTAMTIKEWESHKVIKIMNSIDPTIWVRESIMTDKEKLDNPKYKTTEGYLKTITMKEAWINMWGNMTDENKKIFTTLPNFDSDIFFEITGIKL